jgi:hypothetical protein
MVQKSIWFVPDKFQLGRLLERLFLFYMISILRNLTCDRIGLVTVDYAYVTAPASFFLFPVKYLPTCCPFCWRWLLVRSGASCNDVIFSGHVHLLCLPLETCGENELFEGFDRAWYEQRSRVRRRGFSQLKLRFGLQNLQFIGSASKCTVVVLKIKARFAPPFTLALYRILWEHN